MNTVTNDGSFSLSAARPRPVYPFPVQFQELQSAAHLYPFIWCRRRQGHKTYTRYLNQWDRISEFQRSKRWLWFPQDKEMQKCKLSSIRAFVCQMSFPDTEEPRPLVLTGDQAPCQMRGPVPEHGGGHRTWTALWNTLMNQVEIHFSAKISSFVVFFKSHPIQM